MCGKCHAGNEQRNRIMLEMKCNYSVLKSLSEIMTPWSVHYRSLTGRVITWKIISTPLFYVNYILFWAQ